MECWNDFLPIKLASVAGPPISCTVEMVGSYETFLLGAPPLKGVGSEMENPEFIQLNAPE